MGEKEAKIVAGRWVEGRRAVTAVQLVGVVCGRDVSGTRRSAAGYRVVVAGGRVALWVEM